MCCADWQCIHPFLQGLKLTLNGWRHSIRVEPSFSVRWLLNADSEGWAKRKCCRETPLQPSSSQLAHQNAHQTLNKSSMKQKGQQKHSFLIFFLLWLSKRISRSFWLHFEIVSNAHLPVDYLHTLFFVIFTERSKIPKWQNIEFCSPKYYQGKNITKEIKCYALEGQAIDKLTCFLLSPTIQ